MSGRSILPELPGTSGWAGTSESELEKRKIIPVDFADNLQSIDTIQEFAMKESANVTIMEGGEHWFHTDEQMKFLDQWLRAKLSE